MATFKEEAKAYELKQTLNIADLDRVDLSFPIEERTGTDENGKEFSYKVMIANSTEYRVPKSVLEEVQTILTLKEDVQFVKVSKSGSGLATKYKVSVVN